MARSSGPIVGLDIGSTFIKVVEVSGKGGRPEVTAVGIMPTPPDAVIQGLVIDPPALGVILRHLLEISGVRTKRVISSIAGANNVTVRIIEVPRMPDRELAETMKYEIDRFVPFAHGQQIEKAYQSLPIPASMDGNMQVILTVAVQDVVTSHVQTLRAAGLEPVAIEVEPLAVARSITAFANGGKPLEETVGVINLGAASTELSVVAGGMLVFPRTISIGGDSFTKAIAENLGMRVDAAERLKRQYASIDLEHLAMAQSSQSMSGGGGMSDFGSDFADFGLGPSSGPMAPPMFDAPASQGAAPGLNPLMYGGGAKPGGASAPGFAPPAEDEPKGGNPGVFDLGDAGGDVSEFFPTQVTKPSQPPRPSGPPASGFDLGGFDFGSPQGAPEPAAPSLGAAGFDLGGSPIPGGFDLGDTTSSAGAGAPGASSFGQDFDLAGFNLGPTPAGLGPTPTVGGPTTSEDEDAAQARQVQEILIPVLGELVTEIRRSLEYYRSHNQGLPIARLVLCGGGALMPNMDRFLENELGVPVQIASPLDSVHVSIPSATSEWLKDINPVLAIALGLGERDLVDLPRDYVPRTIAQAQAAAA